MNYSEGGRQCKCIVVSVYDRLKSVLTSNGEVLGEVRNRHGTFQRYSLSPLLFVHGMFPLFC